MRQGGHESSRVQRWDGATPGALVDDQEGTKREDSNGFLLDLTPNTLNPHS